MGRQLSSVEKGRLRKLFSDRIDSFLDAGHGRCWLKEPAIGSMVAQAMRYYHRKRYTLYAFVVMPNHVHALVRPHTGYTLSQVLHNWKSFTAHEAQKAAQASGLLIPKGEAFWQRESYDHLIRDEADFARVLEYIVQNPVKAGLCEKPEEWPYLEIAGALENEASGASPSAGEDACATDAYATKTNRRRNALTN